MPVKYKIKYLNLQGGATDQTIDTKSILFDYSPFINRPKFFQRLPDSGGIIPFPPLPISETEFLTRILDEFNIELDTRLGDFLNSFRLRDMWTALCDLEYLLRNPCKILMSQNVSPFDRKTANGGLTNLQLWNIMKKMGEDHNDQVIIEELKYINFHITMGAPPGTTLYENRPTGDQGKKRVSLIYHSKRLENLSTEMKKYLPDDKSSLNFMLQTTADWYHDRPIDEDRIIAILHGSTIQCQNDQGGFLYNPENEYPDDKLKQAYKNYMDIYYGDILYV